MAAVRTGLDRITAGDGDALRNVRDRRVGLLAHPASVDAALRHARPVLEQAAAKVAVLFGPEHGYGGEAQDMVAVGSAREDVPVYSLYGEREEDLSPQPAHLEGLDVLVVDMQDVGSRYYTYVWTAALALRAAARCGLQTVVLDRPNPLGGDVVEGAPQRPGYSSFVGLYPVSVRHGLTLAEVLTLVRLEEGLDAESLEVVRMEGWQRSMRWEETGLPWVLPSPNMPTIETARVYPGGCLLEGTNLSEGRGTTRPFEIWGAPYLDGAELARRVRIEGAVLRPLRFEPTFQKHARLACGGVQVHVTEPGRFRSYEAYLRLIAAAREIAPADFAWRSEPYEFVTDRPAIDLLTGGPELRTALDEGAELEDVLRAEAEGAAKFMERRRELLLY